MSRLDDMSDGDTEEDEPKLLGLKRPNKESKEGNDDGQIEEQIKRTVKKQRTFTEDILTGRDGLVRIYEDFPREGLFRGRGYELQDMKRLLNMYKEWGFQMYPGLAFPDLLSRCESFGHKSRTKICLRALRDRERDRYVHEVLGVTLNQIRRRPVEESASVRDSKLSQSPGGSTSPETHSPEESFDDNESRTIPYPSTRPSSTSQSSTAAAPSSYPAYVPYSSLTGANNITNSSYAPHYGNNSSISAPANIPSYGDIDDTSFDDELLSMMENAEKASMSQTADLD